MIKAGLGLSTGPGLIWPGLSTQLPTDQEPHLQRRPPGARLHLDPHEHIQEQENRNELKHYSELHLLLSFYFIFFFLCFDGGDVKTKAETTAALRSVSRG